MPAPQRKPSAAARTLEIPGVDTREQRDCAPVSLAPLGVAVPFVLYPDTPRRSTHLRLRGDSAALCGHEYLPGNVGDPKRERPGKVCMACLIEASRRLLEVARR